MCELKTQWLIIGISGVTCGGKTTLANELIQLIPNIKSISQDDYFLPQDSEKHIYIPELKHFNWEILSALDMAKMCSDIEKIVNERRMNITANRLIEDVTNWDQVDNSINKEDLNRIEEKLNKYNIQILLIEGFSIFNYEPIDNLCHFKFYLTLSRDQCYARRSQRTYDPPDVPGYFEQIVWPEHERQLKEVETKSKNVVFLGENHVCKLGIIFTYIKSFFNTFP